MPEFVANPPWYLPVALALVAVVLLFQGNNRQTKRLKWVGLALAVAAAGIFAVGHVFESGREKALRLTREIPEAIDRRDWKRFAGALDPKARFHFYTGRDELVHGTQQTVERVDVKNITVSGIELADEPGGYVTNFMATADIGTASYRLPTNWRFYFAKNATGDDLVLYRIEHVADPRLSQDTVLSRLVRP